jgi:hypothetical protein
VAYYVAVISIFQNEFCRFLTATTISGVYNPFVDDIWEWGVGALHTFGLNRRGRDDAHAFLCA